VVMVVYMEVGAEAVLALAEEVLFVLFGLEL
jgi:hypothetical protein